MELFINKYFSPDLKSDEEVSKNIYEDIKNHIENEEIILNFKDAGILPTVFLNDSIGKIFLEFDLKVILKNLKIVNVKSDEIELIKLVIDSALKMKNNNKM